MAQWLRCCATNRKVTGSISQSALSSGAERLCFCESVVEFYVRRSSVVVCDGEL